MIDKIITLFTFTSFFVYSNTSVLHYRRRIQLSPIMINLILTLILIEVYLIFPEFLNAVSFSHSYCCFLLYLIKIKLAD